MKIAKIIKKLITKTNGYDTPRDNTNSTPTAPPYQHSLQNNHPLYLVPKNYRNALPVTEHTSQSSNFPRSPISHITLHQLNFDDTYDQILEQLHTILFRSQNNHF